MTVSTGEDARARAIEMYVADAPLAEILEATGLSRSAFYRLRDQAGIPPRPTGRQARYPQPEPRACKNPDCREVFTPKHPSHAVNGRGKYCPKCGKAGLRVHPDPGEVACEGCGRPFKPARKAVARGHGRYHSHACWLEHGKPWEKAEEVKRQLYIDDLAEIHRLCEERSLLRAQDVADELDVGRHEVARYVKKGDLKPAVRIELHGVEFVLFERAEVDRFWTKWAKGNNPARKFWLDEDKVAEHWRQRGWYEKRFPWLKTEDAEVIVRASVRRRSTNLAKRRGGRPRGDDRRARLLETGRQILARDGQMPLTDLLGSVALLDWQEHRSDWDGYPASPNDPESFALPYRQTAIKRVRRLVGQDLKKLLQIDET